MVSSNKAVKTGGKIITTQASLYLFNNGSVLKVDVNVTENTIYISLKLLTLSEEWKGTSVLRRMRPRVFGSSFNLYHYLT